MISLIERIERQKSTNVYVLKMLRDQWSYLPENQRKGVKIRQAVVNGKYIVHYFVTQEKSGCYKMQRLYAACDFDKGTICSGKATEFWDDDDTMPEVKSLTEEQLEELKEYVIEYSYKVQEKKDEYWPHYDEYPEMAVLFRYDLWYGEEKYKEDGALCYPDGWDEFIETLMAY